MSLSANNGFKHNLPNISRRKRPVRHGAYINSPKAIQVRARLVSSLVNTAAQQMPWLGDEHLPLLRQWAELEVIRRAAFAGIVQSGLLSTNPKDREVSVRRLVHDHRQIAQTQLMFERELRMTPAARSQIRVEEPTDLVALMAKHIETAEPAAPVEPEPTQPADSPESEPNTKD